MPVDGGGGGGGDVVIAVVAILCLWVLSNLFPPHFILDIIKNMWDGDPECCGLSKKNFTSTSHTNPEDSKLFCLPRLGSEPWTFFVNFLLLSKAPLISYIGTHQHTQKKL
jgi:hypothetical protein